MEKKTRGKDKNRLRGAAAAAALFALTALTAGCSSSSSPGVASTGSATQTASATQSPSTLAYAKCMISHGIKNFPEPGSNGQLQMSAGQQMPDFNSPQVQAAMKACQPLNPAGVGLSPGQQAQHQAALVKYAKCMRSHGVAGFPDPSTNGTFDLGSVNTSSPQFQQADKACSSSGVGVSQGTTS